MAEVPARDPTSRAERAWRIGLAVATFNEDITAPMREDARRRARELGLALVAEADVAGTYDLPLVVRTLLERDDVDAAVALGAVVTGETHHDELIAHACAQALTRLALDHGKPVGLGVTGPGQTRDQARERIDRAGHAVDAVVKQLQTLHRLHPTA